MNSVGEKDHEESKDRQIQKDVYDMETKCNGDAHTSELKAIDESNQKLQIEKYIQQ